MAAGLGRSGKNFKGRVLLCLGGVIAAIVIVGMRIRAAPGHDSPARGRRTSASSPSAESRSVNPPGEAAPAQTAWTGPRLKRLQRLIDERNERGREARRLLEAEGWSTVEASAPDAAVVELDPALLDTDREPELRVQLQTNTPAGEQQLSRAARIAQEASDPKTRYVALEAIGRSSEPRAGHELIALFESVPESRSQILAMLIPRRFDDEVAGFLAGLLAREDLSDELKAQAASQLVALALASRHGWPDEFLLRVPERWRGKLGQLYKQGRG